MMDKHSEPSILNTVSCMDLFDLCDCLEDDSIDMILCDLPYGITACSWDAVIPFEPMWEAFKRIIKPRGAIVLTASQPFTSQLVMSNLDMFRYEWIWDKVSPVGFLNVNRRPMPKHESILVFSDGQGEYNPQLRRDTVERLGKRHKVGLSNNYGHFVDKRRNNVGYPHSILQYQRLNNLTKEKGGLHPTQKPTNLFEYLIRTYTQAGAVVFDPCVGSGTTAIAARNTGRNYIVGDSSAEYVDVARKRLDKPYTLPMFEEAVTPEQAQQTDMFDTKGSE